MVSKILEVTTAKCISFRRVLVSPKLQYCYHIVVLWPHRYRRTVAMRHCPAKYMRQWCISQRGRSIRHPRPCRWRPSHVLLQRLDPVSYLSWHKMQRHMPWLIMSPSRSRIDLPKGKDEHIVIEDTTIGSTFVVISLIFKILLHAIHSCNHELLRPNPIRTRWWEGWEPSKRGS